MGQTIVRELARSSWRGRDRSAQLGVPGAGRCSYSAHVGLLARGEHESMEGVMRSVAAFVFVVMSGVVTAMGAPPQNQPPAAAGTDVLDYDH